MARSARDRVGRPAVPRRALDRGAIEHLLEQLRAAGYREVITNALAPGASLPLVDCRIRDPRPAPPALPRLRRRSPSAGRPAGPAASGSRRPRRGARGRRRRVRRVLAPRRPRPRQAARATPRSHLRVTRGDADRRATASSAGPSGPATCNGSRSIPSAQGEGLGSGAAHRRPALDARRAARGAPSSTPRSTTSARSSSTSSVGFRRLPVGLCVLGTSL